MEELKRRLSSSSIENDDDEDEEIFGQAGKLQQKREEKVQKHVKILDTIDKDSSIAHVIKAVCAFFDNE